MNLKVDGPSYVYITIFCVMMTLIALWAIDISVSALLSGQEAILTNGFTIRQPMVIYHVGLYIVILINFFMSMILVNHIWASHKKEE